MGFPATPGLLVVGLDSADRSLVLDLCAAGELPALSALRERGATGVLRSPPALADDAVWASFATAASPGEHGRFFWRNLVPGSYAMPRFRDEDFGRRPFWEALSSAGLRVAVVDVPKCPVSTGLNGLQLANWLVHGRDRETSSWPPELAREIVARFGDDETDRVGTDDWLCRLESLPEQEYGGFVERVLASVQRKCRASIELLEAESWDLFLTVFKESHCVGHQCWHLHDDEHPDHDPLLAARLGDPVVSVYRALDGAVGELVERVPDETTVLVFSDLGMAPNHTGEHLLDEILLRLERADRPWRSRLRVARRVDAPRRRAYQVEHNELSGAIRVNVEGREPSGRVGPGGELDDFCDRLTADLLDLVDPESGRRIVESVVRCERVFSGEHRDRLPDLLVVWRRDGPITGARSAKIGELRLADHRFRTGNHVADGWFVCAGPSIAPAELSEPASITDVGPTIAALLGVELPGVGGEPIAALQQPEGASLIRSGSNQQPSD